MSIFIAICQLLPLGLVQIGSVFNEKKKTYFFKGIWLKPSSMMRWKNSYLMHAHSADAVVQSFFNALASYFVRRKTDPSVRPPRKMCQYYKIQWKKSAIRLIGGELVLSNGKGNEALRIPWKWGMPVLVEIGFDGNEYELRATYAVDPHSKTQRK